MLGHVEALNALNKEVANAGCQQSQGIEQISAAVSEMDSVTQSNAANAEETAAAAEELSAQAQSLRSAVVALSRMVFGSVQHAKAPAGPVSGPGQPRARLLPKAAGVGNNPGEMAAGGGLRGRIVPDEGMQHAGGKAGTAANEGPFRDL